ncbi:MAG: Nascent polypeptide-associated complex protein [Candidatus Thorarchaeota archaeon]|nr:Nascent polypeptide-associated complex protein [Candidatus Thorarchaeota archaeon]
MVMGFRGTSPKQLARMMKRMGIEQKDLSGVREVLIRFDDKEWLIKSPQVTMIRQPGGEVFQVVGSRTERPRTSGAQEEPEKLAPQVKQIPMEDAALVAGQTGVSIEAAMEALKETGGDLAAAILRLRHS